MVLQDFDIGVQVIESIVDDASLPYPVDHDLETIFKVKEVVGLFVHWPCCSMVLLDAGKIKCFLGKVLEICGLCKER